MDSKAKQDWGSIILEFNKSGQNQTDFCRDRGLEYKVFNKKLNGQKNELVDHTTWIATKVTPIKPQLQIEIGKFKISVIDYSKETLKDVMEVLSSQC